MFFFVSSISDLLKQWLPQVVSSHLIKDFNVSVYHRDMHQVGRIGRIPSTSWEAISEERISDQICWLFHYDWSARQAGGRID